MGVIDKIKFHVWDDVSAVIDVIKEWKPRKCKSEKDYENALCRKLEKQFPGIEIIPQYNKNGIRGDIVVGGKVLIEIKYDLKSITTLLGQLMRYKRLWPGRVLVLLTGETKPSLVKELKEFIDKEGLNSGWDMSSKFTVFKK
jgi:hypothetical protein